MTNINDKPVPGDTTNTIEEPNIPVPSDTIIEPLVIETPPASRISEQVKQQTKNETKKEITYNLFHNRANIFSFKRNIHHSIKNNVNYQQSVKEANTGSMGRLFRLKQRNKR